MGNKEDRMGGVSNFRQLSNWWLDNWPNFTSLSALHNFYFLLVTLPNKIEKNQVGVS